MKLFIFITLFVIVSCRNDNYEPANGASIPLYTHELVKVDSLVFFNTNNLFVGNIRNITYWNDYILVGDREQCKVFIFDKNLNFLNTVGRKGRGPGEFVDLPVIVPNDNLRLIDTNTHSLYEFDDDFTLRNSHSLPAELYLNIFWPPLSFNEHIIVTGNGVRYPINDDRYFTHYKSLFLLDDEYNLIDNFYDWNDIYFERSYDAYKKTRSGVNLTKGPDNTFYANQKATHIIDQFDSGFNIIHSFGLKPRYYRTPPENVSFDEIQRSLEHFIEYNIETTNIENIHFDEKKNHVYLSYTNSTKESMTRRDWTLGQQYLQVYDENYDCIFDDKIPGIFSFADNGNIYIRTSETPEYFSLSIYRLKDRMDK